MTQRDPCGNPDRADWRVRIVGSRTLDSGLFATDVVTLYVCDPHMPPELADDVEGGYTTVNRPEQLSPADWAKVSSAVQLLPGYADAKILHLMQVDVSTHNTGTHH